MKPITNGLCMALFLLFSVHSFAQKPSSPKPFLFTAYPSVINCTEAQLNSLFDAGSGERVSLVLPGNLTLQGTITSKTTRYNSLQTVAIKLPAFRNVLFSVSKRNDAGNKPVYIGHLFNADYADGYQLKRTADNTYQFTKIETEKLLPTCNQ